MQIMRHSFLGEKKLALNGNYPKIKYLSVRPFGSLKKIDLNFAFNQVIEFRATLDKLSFSHLYFFELFLSECDTTD